MATTGAQASSEQMFAETPEAVFGGEDIGPGTRRPSPGRSPWVCGSVPRAARLGVGLWAELARVAMGVSKVEAQRGDWRFADPAWNDNPGYQRLKQAYLAWSDAMLALAEDPKADWRTAERARFAMTVLTSAAAPTNYFRSEPGRPEAGVRYRAEKVWPVAPGTSSGTCAAMAACRPRCRRASSRSGRTWRSRPGPSSGGTSGASSSATRRRRRGCDPARWWSSPPRSTSTTSSIWHPGRSFVEYEVSRGHPGFHGELAQPGARTRPVGPRRVRHDHHRARSTRPDR